MTSDLRIVCSSAMRVGLLLGLALWVVGCQSGPPPSLVEQGNLAFAEGQYRAADALFAQALATNARWVEALHGRARVAVAMHQPEAALRGYTQISKIDRSYITRLAKRDYAQALFEAARGRLDTQASEQALQAMRALERLMPGYPGFDAQMARVLTSHAAWLTMHGRRAEAMRLYKQAISLDPSSAAPYVGAAEILLTDGKRQAALALLTDAQRRSPGDRRIRALTVQAMGLY
jgi:tetratricopeptide (TPR) repeat protein